MRNALTRWQRFQKYATSNGLGALVLYTCYFMLKRLIYVLNNTIAKSLSKILMKIERISYLNYINNNNSSNIEETITEKEFLMFCDIFPIGIGNYYRRRWPYLKEVIDFVKRERPKHVIELGAYLIPLVRNSHVMDIEQGMPQQKYVHDATVFPWPIEDDQYDLFIALQVWEHLDQKQEEAFKEVMRVARTAVISFPYRWYCPGDIHHNIDMGTIARWTMHVPPEKVIQVGTRIIYFFRFSVSARTEPVAEINEQATLPMRYRC